MSYAEELQQGVESIQFSVRHLTRVAADESAPPMLRHAVRMELAAVRQAAFRINEIHTILESEK